jgi:type II secretory pathway component PulF
MSELAFEYRALDRRGAPSRGTTRAQSREEAYRKLTASGLTPTRLRSIRTNKRLVGGQRISARDIAHFTYQLAVLIEARIPIADGLTSISDQEGNRRLAEIIEDIARRISSGDTITDALSAHAQHFGETYIETIRAAEQSGNLVRILNHLSGMLEQQTETRQQIRGALLYPTLVIGALSIAVIFLVTFVVPRFADMFAERNVALPAPTRVLIAISTGFRVYWWAIGGGVIAAVLGLRHTWRGSSGRRFIDRCLHRVPYLRQILIGLGVGRFARVFGLSLSAGLPLIDCLELSGRASGRPMLRADTERMMEQVSQGGRLSDVLMACTYLPGFARRMIAAGEESAELPRMCDIVARHYHRDVGHMTKNIGTVIEPVLVAGMAALVLGVALAIFLPMWNMVSLLE